MLPMKETLSALLHSTPHLPLYEFFLNLWLSFGDTDVYARMLSVIFSAASLFAAYKIFIMTAGRRTAAAALFLLAVSPHHIMFGRIVREYSLLSLLALTSSYFFLKLTDATGGDVKRRRIFYFISTLALISTHYYAWFIVLSQNIYFFIIKRNRQEILKWVMLQGGLLLVFLPWLLINLNYLLSADDYLTTYYGSIFGRHVKIFYMFFVFSLGLTVFPWNWPVVIPAALGFSVPFITGTVRILKNITAKQALVGCEEAGSCGGRNIKRPLFCAIMFFVPFAFAIAIPPFAPRQLLGSLPFFYLIISAGIFSLKSQKIRILLIIIICLTIAASLNNYFRNAQYFDRDMITPWDSITGDIEEKASEEDVIVLVINYSANFYRYYDGPARRIYTLRGEPWYGIYHSRIYSDKFEIKRVKNLEQISPPAKPGERVWILVSQAYSETPELLSLLEETEARNINNYFYGKQSIRGLREGWTEFARYGAYLYRLYLWE